MAHRSLHPLLHYLRRLRAGDSADDGDDAQLLRRFVNGRDESAFAALVRRHGALVWGLCARRLGETPDAEDAFQATFLVLARKAASLHGPRPLGPWLYGVARRTAAKVHITRARRAARERCVPPRPDVAPPDAADGEWRLVLDEEINRLPERYRLPIVLCYLQGLSGEEAARQLGCASGTVFSRLSRARGLLRRRLARRGLGVSAGALAVALAEGAAPQAPAALCESTVRLALLSAAGAPIMPAPLAALVEGVVRGMFISKLRFVAVVVLALGLVGSGVGLFGHRTGAEQPAPKKAGAESPPGAGTKEVAADKPKDRGVSARPPQGPPSYVPPPAVLDEKQRLREWRDKLLQHTPAPPLKANTTLPQVLEMLSQHSGVNFIINERAFRLEGVASLPVLEDKVGSLPLPEAASLRSLLQAILNRLDTGAPFSEAVFILRKDHIEITTSAFLRAELGYRNNRPVPPLVWDSFEETPLAKALPRLAEVSGYNVMADPRAGEKLQAKITAQLNNVPVDTAVRLLANMAGLTVVRLDNVFYVTTADNARQLSQEQDRINADLFDGMGGKLPEKAAPDKGAR